MIRVLRLPDGCAHRNLGTGDYNNDLTTSSTSGDVWTSTFTGTGVTLYAPETIRRGIDRDSD